MKIFVITDEGRDFLEGLLGKRTWKHHQVATRAVYSLLKYLYDHPEGVTTQGLWDYPGQVTQRKPRVRYEKPIWQLDSSKLILNPGEAPEALKLGYFGKTVKYLLDEGLVEVEDIIDPNSTFEYEVDRPLESLSEVSVG